jgi:hypothetical protein
VRLSRAAECSVIGPRGSSEPWVVIARNVPLTAEGQQPLLCARRHPSGTGRSERTRSHGTSEPCAPGERTAPRSASASLAEPQRTDVKSLT